MKGSSMNTHMGNIVIDNEVIAQYAGSVAVECFGIVGTNSFTKLNDAEQLTKKSLDELAARTSSR